MSFFSSFLQKKVQIPTLYSNTCGTVPTRYGNPALPAVNLNRLGFPEQLPKPTHFAIDVWEPAFTPLREANYIPGKGNSEGSSASKKSNFHCPRLLRKNALFWLKSPETETLAEEVIGVLTLELNTTQ